MMKPTLTRMTLGLTVATLALGGIAYAQGAMPGMQHDKFTADADGNGTVTRAEAQAAATAMFAKMDANKDGKLDKADREARRTEMAGKMFAMIDKDKNGSISKDEFMAAHGPRPDGHGPDGHHMAGMQHDMPMGGPDGPPPPQARDGEPDGGHGKGGHMGGHMGGRMGGHGMGGMMMMARMADTDKDGAISQAEFTAAAMKHFEMADANKDGQVTKDERQAMHEKMRGMMKAEGPAKKPGE